MSNKQKLKKFKLVAIAMACVATTSAFVLTSCKDKEPEKDDTTPAAAKVDNQLLKNGNFEFYSENADESIDPYLIASANNWSQTSLATSSYTKSGVINTTDFAWTKMSNKELPEALDYNNKLKPSDENYDDMYVDYNGMKSSDILYKDTAKAIKEDATEEDKELIENPLTHNTVKQEGSAYYYLDEKGDKVQLYKNSDGELFTDEACTKPYESHVLMLHNYLNSNRNGTAQKYSASSTITLEANTSAEVSVWVKTSNLVYGNGQTVHQDRGAFIEISHTVGSTSLDSMFINNINTEKLNPKPASGEWENNGWVKYTIYVQGCDYASSSFSVSLGLGETGANLVEGYAFFDDVQVKKYKNLSETTIDTTKVAQNASGYVDKENGGTTCTLLSSAENKVFEADTAKYQTEDKRFSENFYYLLDLTASNAKQSVVLGSDTVKAALTRDDTNYVPLASSNATLSGVAAETYDKAYTNPALSNLNTSADIIANVATDENAVNNAFSSSVYKKTISEALLSANTLPGAEASSQAVVLLSAGGAPYTAYITNTQFTVAAESRTIISFWVKTSDMSNKTAATIALIDNSDKDNKATVTVDTTGVKTDIGEEKDIYNGWVECFFFVENEAETAKTYTMNFSFGSTAIIDTTYSNYSYGYAMLSNLHMLNVDEEEFEYASSTAYTATLVFSDDEDGQEKAFDSVSGALTQHLKENISAPANYKGVNGGSAAIKPTGEKITEFDYFNSNGNAGVLNKKYFADYIKAIADDETNANYAWLKRILDSKGYTNYVEAMGNAENIWKEIFGNTATQPLLIVNTVREYAEGKKALNYGYLGTNASVSKDGYKAVSVKVKVSNGGVAYIYLVNTNNKKMFSYSGNGYTFWYDDEGNVLKGDPEAEGATALNNLAYVLRNDGLYEQYGADDGKLYANIYNYAKLYYDESESYYVKGNSNALSFEEIDNKSEVDYYNSADCTTFANHYLVADDGTKVYQFTDGTYYYIENNKATSTVLPFDTNLATPRYDTADVNEDYVYVVDTRSDASLADKWITVNFFLHAGSVDKNYRLEVWSGDRNSTGTDENEKTTYNGKQYYAASTEGSTVIFDYSYSSLEQTTYTNLLTEYENIIIGKYKELLKNKGLLDKLTSANDVTIASLEKLCATLVAEGALSKADVDAVDEYTAHYYMFTLYDSTSYVPFNENTAGENETGYKYNIADNSETLSYLSYTTETVSGKTYTVFADYSTMEQQVEKGTAAVEEETPEEKKEIDYASIGLLAASIILAVVLIATLIILLVRSFLKKNRKNRKVSARKSDIANKKKRYIRKLNLAETITENGDEDNSDGDNA